MAGRRGSLPQTAASLDEFRSIGLIGEKPKEILVKQFKPRGDRISIVPITDSHYGARNCNIEKFKAYLAYIMRTPDCYAIGLGDYMENATRTSVGLGMYEEDLHSEDQLQAIQELLAPLARARKLIGLHCGNHERRTQIAAGLNPVKIIANNLGVPYLGYTAVHKWVAGDQIYDTVSAHGCSGAKTSTGRRNAIYRLKDIIEADLYFTGHLHDQDHFRDMVFRPDPVRDVLVRRNRHFVICGSLLEYFGGYADMMNLLPSATGLVRIDLYTNRHNIDVILGH